MSNESGLEYRKLKEHLHILQETFICKEVRPFFTNRQKELSKSPKIFFIDLGFRNNLMENMNLLDKHADKGAIVENAVFIRLNELYEGLNKINFWRTKAGAEVDFILHISGKTVPIEVKYTLHNPQSISKSLMSYIDLFSPELTIVLTKNYMRSTERKSARIIFMPVYYL